MLYSTNKIIITCRSWMGCSTKKIIIKYGNRLVYMAIYYKWQPTAPYCHLYNNTADHAVSMLWHITTNQLCCMPLIICGNRMCCMAIYYIRQPLGYTGFKYIWQPIWLHDYFLHVTNGWTVWQWWQTIWLWCHWFISRDNKVGCMAI